MTAARPVSEAELWSRSLAWLGRCDGRALLLILLLALGVRWISFVRNDLIGTDSMRFLQAAEQIELGHVTEAFSDPFHPGLSLLTAALNRTQRAILGAPEGFEEDRTRRERAAYGIVLCFGLLIVGLEIALARRLFPEVPPGLVGLLAACQPYLVRSSVDIMSDTPMLAGVLLALLAASARRERLGMALLCGLSIGFAYLSRPEGLVVAPAVLAFWWFRDRARPARLALCSALLLAGLTLTALPYAAAISLASGTPTLTLKKDLYRMIGIGGGGRSSPSPVPESTSGVERPRGEMLASTVPLAGLGLLVGSLAAIAAAWFDATPEVLALAFLAGLAHLLRHGPRREGHLLYGLCALFTVAVLTLLLVSEGDPDYLSRRHVFVLMVLSLPLAARGLLGIGGWLGGRVAALGVGRASVLTVAGTLLGLSLHATAAHRDAQDAQLEAARLILAGYGPGEVVFTDREKVTYYAGAAVRPLPRDAITLARQLRELPRAWAVFYYEGETCCGALAAALDAWGAPIERFARIDEPGSRPPRSLLVYRSVSEAPPPVAPR